MASPQPQRSTYRERRISVMLNEGTSQPGTASQPNLPRPDVSSENRTASRNRFITISLVTALACAAAMFFLLFRRDSSQVVKNVPVQPVQAPATQSSSTQPPPNQTSVRKDSSAVASPQAAASFAAPAQVAGAPAERVRFKLRRTNKLQKFGNLSLRVTVVNARRGYCNMLVGIEDQTPNLHTLQLNRPFQVPAGDSASSSIVVTGMSRDSVSGYIAGR